MTIKGTSTSVTLKNIPKLFGVAAILAVILRIIQMLKFIDAETGFFVGGSFFTVALYLILFACSVAFVVKAYLSAESDKIQLHEIKNVPLGAGTLFFAVSLIFDFVSGFTSMSSASGASADFKDLMLTGAMPRFLQSIFAIFSALYFIILSKDFSKGTMKASKHRVLATMPVGWAGFRMVCRFVRQISFIRVSDLFLELIMLAMMLIFFMALAQVLSGVYSEGFRWRLPSFGAGAALIAVTLSIPRLIFTIVDFEGYINTQHTFQLADFAFAVFIVLLLVTVCKGIIPYSAYNKNGEE